jgi:hypothetical protein
MAEGRRPTAIDMRPVLIAGPDRSGTTLMFALLAAHPDLSMVRRSNMFRYFHGRYGDLSEPENLERCLGDMLRYKRLQALEPDGDRIRREFAEGPATYGRLFALFHAHHVERFGRSRWGDKSLHTEHYAERVFAEFPDARIVHMLRDPRDRYASVRRRHGGSGARLGRGVGRWLDSTDAALRHAARWPDRYLLVRYEDLCSEPERVVREVCRFIDEPFAPRMLSMDQTPEHRDRSNSSFGDIAPGTISTKGIGRFHEVLTPSEIGLIQALAHREMEQVGYALSPLRMSMLTRVRFILWDRPLTWGRVTAWRTYARFRRRRGVDVPPSRLTPVEG